MDPWIRYELYQKHIIPKTKPQEEEDERMHEKYSNIITMLPRESAFEPIYYYQGFWFTEWHLKGIMSAYDHFKAQPTDIFLASYPKSGTTWLKSLIFCIVHRGKYPCSSTSSTHHPLLLNNPHDLVLQLEHHLYGNNRICELDADFPRPRVLATHIPYSTLPYPVLNTGSRVVYICRNPKDTFISYWRFLKTNKSKRAQPDLSLEEFFEIYVKGTNGFGQYWDHVLEYWRGSLEKPDNVLFIKYEQLQAGPVAHLKKLAAFVGVPFSEDEERDGVVEEILKLCSFENLAGLEVNKTGALPLGISHSSFFRKGKVGDWENYMTDEMIKKFDNITHQKFHSSGLSNFLE